MFIKQEPCSTSSDASARFLNPYDRFMYLTGTKTASACTDGTTENYCWVQVTAPAAGYVRYTRVRTLLPYIRCRVSH